MPCHWGGYRLKLSKINIIFVLKLKKLLQYKIYIFFTYYVKTPKTFYVWAVLRLEM